jgi:hypothetical protein
LGRHLKSPFNMDIRVSALAGSQLGDSLVQAEHL